MLQFVKISVHKIYQENR